MAEDNYDLMVDDVDEGALANKEGVGINNPVEEG